MQKALLLTPLCSTEPPLLSPLPGGDFLFSSMLRVSSAPTVFLLLKISLGSHFPHLT